MTQNPHKPDPETGRPDPDPGQDHLAPEPEAVPEDAVPEDASAQIIEALKADLAHAKDQALRALAESENTRKRLLREREDVRQHAIANFARDMLDFADNFRRALGAVPEDLKTVDDRIKGVLEGIEAMEKEFLRAFDKHGVKKIEPLGEPFNANYHEAMFEAPGTGKPGGTIIQVIEAGYVLHDRLLRPARVGIAKDDGHGKPGEPGSRVDTEA